MPSGNSSDESYLTKRIDDISNSFPGVLSMDDFLMRTEMALSAHNFRGDNCMAMCNVCRDEATGYFKSRVDKVFGPSFNLNGLGACLTCGRLGARRARPRRLRCCLPSVNTRVHVAVRK